MSALRERGEMKKTVQSGEINLNNVMSWGCLKTCKKKNSVLHATQIMLSLQQDVKDVIPRVVLPFVVVIDVDR